MKTKPFKFLLALTFLFFFSSSSVVFIGDWQDAFRGKDYETTRKFGTQLAEQGDVHAQKTLDIMLKKEGFWGRIKEFFN
jgi:hypothetical protein